MEIKPFTLENIGSLGQASPEAMPPSFGSIPGLQTTTQPEAPQKDIKTIEEEAYQRGLAEGLSQGKGEKLAVEQQLSTNLNTVGTQLEALNNNFLAALTLYETNATKLALEIAKKIAGKALEENTIAPIDSLVKQCLPCILEQPNITISIHPNMQSQVEEKVTTTLKEKNANLNITFLANEALQESDVTIEWTNGIATRNTSEMWDKITDILALPEEPKEASEPTAEATETTEAIPEATTENQGSEEQPPQPGETPDNEE